MIDRPDVVCARDQADARKPETGRYRKGGRAREKEKDGQGVGKTGEQRRDGREGLTGAHAGAGGGREGGRE